MNKCIISEKLVVRSDRKGVAEAEAERRASPPVCCLNVCCVLTTGPPRTPPELGECPFTPVYQRLYAVCEIRELNEL